MEEEILVADDEIITEETFEEFSGGRGDDDPQFVDE